MGGIGVAGWPEQDRARRSSMDDDEKLADMRGLRPMDHHREKQGHKEREEIEANSLRPKTRAGDRRQRVAAA